jgi:hypothetical protein
VRGRFECVDGVCRSSDCALCCGECVPIPDQLAVGSYFVTVTKPLQSTRWQAMHEEKFLMSWGRATVIIQKKMF